MRKLMLALAAALTVLTASSFGAKHAQAMTLPAPSGLSAAIADAHLTEDVRWVCGRYGRCRWVRGYRAFRPYGYRIVRPYRYRAYRGYRRPVRRWRRW